MKTNALLVSSLLSLALAHHASAQGSLTPPPGVPGPVMKSLDQIEARTPISSVPFTISQPGSYYLVTNLVVATGDAITITTGGVTLDLNGFTISSSSATLSGTAIVFNSGDKDIKVTNGHIRGSLTYDSGTGTFSGGGFNIGIARSGISPQNVLISDLTISGCGTGISLSGSYIVITSCSARTIQNFGFNATTVENCHVSECGGTGISAAVANNSRANVTGSGEAIIATTVMNCFGTSVSGPGISCTSVINSYGFSTSGNGIVAETAQNSFGRTTFGLRGMQIAGTASFCRGRNDAGAGVAIEAAIAVGCTAANGSITSVQKHLGTP